MTDVSLLHTSGGLLGDVFVDALRQPEPETATKVLADPSSFTDATGQAPRRAEYENDLDAVFRAATALWGSYADELESGMDVGRLRDRLLIPFFRNLGFDPVYQRSHIAAGDGTWAISHLGWPDDPDAPPILMVPDADLDARTSRGRSPHEELQGYLNSVPARWGIVTNGRVLRLLRDYHHTRSRGYVEIDLEAIFTSQSWPDYLAAYRLLHVSRFRPIEIVAAQPAAQAGEDDDTDSDDEGAEEEVSADVQVTSLLELAYEQNLNAGVAAGKRLQPQIRTAIETIANGLLDATPGLRQTLTETPEAGRGFYQETLTVLYRILFLLLAEQRGMLNNASPLYSETYSLTALRARAENDDAEPRRHDLWEGLKTTFRLFSDPDAAATVNVYPYNGQLFDLARTPLTTGGKCDNKHLLDAIRALTTVPVGKMRMHVDYRNLGVEELGTVYESLLDYSLTIATEATASGNRVIRAGQAYLAPLSIERSDLASYYTPTDLVDLLLARSLDPLIDQRLTDAGTDPAAREQALLDLRVIDPACGSAAILIGALDRIAAAVARERTQPREPRDTDLAFARRDVLQRCIFGVDKDPFAVELAKVALWIHCVVPDQPLSFLDSHIVQGDALIGWPLLDLPAEIPSAAFHVQKASPEDKKILNRAKKHNTQYLDAAAATPNTLFAMPKADPHLELPDALAAPEITFEDVRAKSAAYRSWKSSSDYARWKAAADLWTAAFFWTADFGSAPTTEDYQKAIAGNVDATFAHLAAQVIADLDPLHWPLAFPDVRDRGGFDLVLGNPPWEQFKGEEQKFFAQSAPRIAAMTSEHRPQAIRDLETSDPALYQRWRQYQSLQGRLAHFAKTSGRFTRTANEANTYVLFIDLAASVADRSGLIVKSGIATDNTQSVVWKRLLDAGRVGEVRDMQNVTRDGALVFPAVTRDERFCILVLRPPVADEPFQASMMNFGVEEAATSRTVSWSRKQLRDVSPTTCTLLSTGVLDEVRLVQELHGAHGTLDFIGDKAANPWGIGFHSLFHSTGVKKDGHAIRSEALTARGFRLTNDKVFLHENGQRALPIYEGQMANRWDHRARTYQGYLGPNKFGRKPNIPWVTESQHADRQFEVEPRYWMPEDVALERLDDVAKDRWLIAYRDVGRAYSEKRNLRACLLPRYPATDTLPVLSVEPGRALALLALLNSMTFDFLVRVHMPGGHAKPWILAQCAAPDVSAFPTELTDLAARLTVTSESVAVLSGLPVTRWRAAEREALDARLDAMVARLYGLDRRRYEIVLDHFTALRRAEEKSANFGEYRSKRLRLEAFDALNGGGA